MRADFLQIGFRPFLAGGDGHFYPAQAKLHTTNSCRVWSELVEEPVAVRYAWGTVPSGPLVTAGSPGLPVAPFRTDREVWPDAGFENSNDQRTYVKTQRNRAEAQIRKGKEMEAKQVLEQK